MATLDETLLEPQLVGPGEIVYRDLVAGVDGGGVPWVPGGLSLAGLDCATVTYIACRRAGLAVPRHALWHCDAGQDQAAAFAAYLEAQGRLWERLRDGLTGALELGDVVQARGDGEGLHLTAVVSVARRLGITAFREHGVRVLPLAALRGVTGVWRFRGAGP